LCVLFGVPNIPSYFFLLYVIVLVFNENVQSILLLMWVSFSVGDSSLELNSII